VSIFDMFTDPIENALDLADDLVSGEEIDARKVAKLASAGLTVIAIASATGYGLEVIEKILEDQ
jgi:hypothetical protein